MMRGVDQDAVAYSRKEILAGLNTLGLIAGGLTLVPQNAKAEFTLAQVSNTSSCELSIPLLSLCAKTLYREKFNTSAMLPVSNQQEVTLLAISKR